MPSAYFEKNALRGPLIDDPIAEDIGAVVVIPAMDEPHLVNTLESLAACTGVRRSFEVIVVVNHPEHASSEVKQQNRQSVEESRRWAQLHPNARMRTHVLFEPDLPKRKAGVGLARKIGMDEAARRLSRAGNGDLPIICLDADCTCSANYIAEIQDFFITRQHVEGCAISFEHPLYGLTASQRRNIAAYELHLRCYILGQRWAGFPWAFHTVGSSMAVRANIYMQVGGMNTRRAGEDFYFFHKVAERGKCGLLKTATVHPSARPSDRVPFGTGRAMLESQQSGMAPKTYHPRSYEDVKVLFDRVSDLRIVRDPLGFLDDMPEAVRVFLAGQDFAGRIDEIRTNTASGEAFVKRFFRWFNAFRLMKYMHDARDRYYPDVPVEKACAWIFEKYGQDPADCTIEDCLQRIRDLERG